MTRHALAIAALPLFAALAAPASAQTLCDRPVAQLTPAQFDACRVGGIVLLRPPIETHPDNGVTILRGQ